MHVTNGDIWVAQDALQKLVHERWPVKTAYWLAKLAQKLRREYGVIDAVRVGLIQQYGTTNGGGQVSISPESEDWAAFAAAFNELMAQETEIDVEKIVLPGEGDVDVEPATLLALEPFVEVA